MSSAEYSRRDDNRGGNNSIIVRALIWSVSYLLSSICCDYAYRSADISNISSPIQKSPISHGIGDVLKSWDSPYDDGDDDDDDDDDNDDGDCDGDNGDGNSDDDDGGDDGDCDDDGSDCNDDDCDDDDDDYDVPHIQSQSQLV